MHQSTNFSEAAILSGAANHDFGHVHIQREQAMDWGADFATAESLRKRGLLSFVSTRLVPDANSRPWT